MNAYVGVEVFEKRNLFDTRIKNVPKVIWLMYREDQIEPFAN